MDFSEKSRIAYVLFMVSGYLNTVVADPRTNVASISCNRSASLSGDDNVITQNFVLAMSNLSNMINQNGHGTTIVGKGTDVVFGLAQCFKDLNSTDCRLCFSEIRSRLPTCNPNTGGRIFLDGCFGRYENFSFFHESMDSRNSKVCSPDRTGSQTDKFRETVKFVAGNVSLEAQKNQGFAVGSVSSPNITLYALAQCWESLDKESCNTCLQSAVSSIISCSPAFEGRSLNAGCYMRYSNRIFWNLNQTSPNPEGKGGDLWIILVSVFGGFLLLAGIAILKAKGYLGKKLCRSSKGFSASISQSELNFRYQELRNATKNFHASNKLGQGSYGSVYKGVLPDGREIAVKRLFLNTRQWIDQFLNEVNMVKQVRHKNLVMLLGCSADGPESLLVYEYYFNKSLDQFIFGIPDEDEKNRAHLLDWQKRFDIIQGVAEGLRYLHEGSEVRIVHRDIKASNILLDNKFKPKITDFGLARSFAEDQTHLSTGIAGTLGYMAPEYVVHGRLTEKADVYSFGILTLEIVTGQRCGNAIDAQAKQFFLAKIWSHYKDNTVDMIIDRSFYDEGIKDEILHVVHVGLLCTQAAPDYRPTMAKVVELLRSNEDEGNLSPTDPPFLDEIVMDSHMEGGELHLLSSASAPSLVGSSESFISWR